MIPWAWSDQVTLDGSGNGTIPGPTPNYGETYYANTAAVQVQPRPSTLEPECSITINGQFIGGSVTASFDSDSTFTEEIGHGDKLEARFTGGDPGKVAILTLRGKRS